MKEKTEIGKTKDPLPKNIGKTETEKPNDKEINKVREVIISIIEHSDIIMLAAKNQGGKNIIEALAIIEKNNWTSIIEKEFEVRYDVIKYVFTMGVIKNEWVDILHG
jgi:hypothetical protein